MKAVYLCYVKDNFAWFTDAPFDQVRGDDWDDAPYEDNASSPFVSAPYTLFKVAWEVDLRPPCSTHGSNGYSVDDINTKRVPWLRPYSYSTHNVHIWAGCALEEFINRICQIGGAIYLPYKG